MPGEDLGERTEEATPKRLRDARQEGNVPKSQDLASAMVLIGGSAVLALLMSNLIVGGADLIKQVLDSDWVSDPLNPDQSDQLVNYVLAGALRLAAPLLLGTWLVGAMSQFVQVGPLLSAKSITPSLNKLDPIKGFKRIFSIAGLVKVLLDAAKIALVFTIVGITVTQYRDEILTLPYRALGDAVQQAGWMLVDLIIRIGVLLLILGVVDFVFQKHKHSKDMRMTKQEVKDEMKQTDGSPETKRRRMQMAQQLAQQRVGAAVPQADVIVTNPEHISIAIKYDAENMHAPVVVAKGADLLAMRIRQIARQHNIPIVERKPLARALYRDVEVGQEVPEDFYKAVAEILAYVYRLNNRAVPAA